MISSKNDHFLDPDWSCAEELLLFNCLSKGDFQNWDEVAETLRTKTREQCALHVMKYYLHSPCAPFPVPGQPLVQHHVLPPELPPSSERRPSQETVPIALECLLTAPQPNLSTPEGQEELLVLLRLYDRTMIARNRLSKLLLALPPEDPRRSELRQLLDEIPKAGVGVKDGMLDEPVSEVDAKKHLIDATIQWNATVSRVLSTQTDWQGIGEQRMSQEEHEFIREEGITPGAYLDWRKKILNAAVTRTSDDESLEHDRVGELVLKFLKGKF
jgi:hypothetical protein